MVGVGPAGTQQVVVVLTGADGPLATPALADCGPGGRRATTWLPSW